MISCRNVSHISNYPRNIEVLVSSRVSVVSYRQKIHKNVPADCFGHFSMDAPMSYDVTWVDMSVMTTKSSG